jgi:hypothetical protein
MSRRAIITVNDHFGRPHTAGGETVFESDGAPVFTGLLDADGNPLYYHPERHPIGFDLGWDRDE